VTPLHLGPVGDSSSLQCPVMFPAEYEGDLCVRPLGLADHGLSLHPPRTPPDTHGNITSHAHAASLPLLPTLPKGLQGAWRTLGGPNGRSGACFNSMPEGLG